MKNLNLSEENILMDFNKVCKKNDLKNRKGKRFIVDDVEVAIFKVDEKVFALSNVCPHQHFALMYDGFIEEDCVVCPMHGWMFDLRTGKTPMGAQGLQVFEVKIIDEDVFVKAKKKNFNW